jgi:hypothetical protein
MCQLGGCFVNLFLCGPLPAQGGCGGRKQDQGGACELHQCKHVAKGEHIHSDCHCRTGAPWQLRQIMPY